MKPFHVTAISLRSRLNTSLHFKYDNANNKGKMLFRNKSKESGWKGTDLFMWKLVENISTHKGRKRKGNIVDILGTFSILSKRYLSMEQLYFYFFFHAFIHSPLSCVYTFSWNLQWLSSDKWVILPFLIFIDLLVFYL